MNRRDLLLGLVGLAAVPALPKLPANGVGPVAVHCTGTGGARAIVRLLMPDGTYKVIGEVSKFEYKKVQENLEPYVLGSHTFRDES